MGTGLQFDDLVTGSSDAPFRTKDAAVDEQPSAIALHLQSGERVLDIGTGPGFWPRRWLQPRVLGNKSTHRYERANAQ